MVGLTIAQPKTPKVSNPETKFDKHEELENLKSSVSRSDKNVSNPYKSGTIFLYVWAVLSMASYSVFLYAKENKHEQLETVAFVIACILLFWPAVLPLLLLALVLISPVLWLVLSLVLCLPPWRCQELLQLVCKEEGREEKKHLVNKKKKRKEDYYSIV